MSALSTNTSRVPGTLKDQRQAQELNSGERRRDREQESPPRKRSKGERHKVGRQNTNNHGKLRHGAQSPSQSRRRELSQVDWYHHRGKATGAARWSGAGRRGGGGGEGRGGIPQYSPSALVEVFLILDAAGSRKRVGSRSSQCRLCASKQCAGTGCDKAFYRPEKNIKRKTRTSNKNREREPHPQAKPVMARAGMSQVTLGAKANSSPPNRKIQALAMMAPLRPFLLEMEPAAIAPKGPPMANTETTVAHCAVVCPGNTTGSGAFCAAKRYRGKGTGSARGQQLSFAQTVPGCDVAWGVDESEAPSKRTVECASAPLGLKYPPVF